jgi:hypothetical protein
MTSPSLKEFLLLDPEEIDINVTKVCSNLFMTTTYEVVLEIFQQNITCTVHKRYTEFQGFYDSLTFRYQNLQFPEFPSKFQVLKKEETRKKFFESLVKTVVKLASTHQEIKKELMKLLYEFIFGQSLGNVASVEIKKEAKRSHDTTSILNNPNDSYFSDTQSMISGTTKGRSEERSMFVSLNHIYTFRINPPNLKVASQ